MMLTLLLAMACQDPADKAPTQDDSTLESRAPDDSAPVDDTGDSPILVDAAVRVNEAQSDNDGAIEDGDGDASDWIEVYNSGDEAVDLAGWALSDDPDDPEKWRFPSLVLQPGELRVVWASGKDADGPEGETHTNFALDNSGETLTLSTPEGALAQVFEVPALEEGWSWGPQQSVREQVAVTDGSAGRFWGAPTGDWTAPDYDDAAWHPVVLPIGFDTSVAAGPPAERALGRPTSQSSDGYGRTGAQAVDGDPATFSHTGDADMAPYWAVDLGADYAISAISLINRRDCCAERLYNITVELLDADGASVWSSGRLNPFDEGQTPVTPGARVELEPDAIGRSVRVSKTAINGSYSSEWLSLAEVEVTGALMAPYAADIATDVSAWMSDPGGLRVEFVLNEAAPTRAVLALRYDDSAELSVDGVELFSGNAALAEPHDATPEARAVLPLRGLEAGPHALAVSLRNIAADDPDLFLGAALTFQWITDGDPALFPTPTPGEPNGQGYAGQLQRPLLDPSRGFYDAAQTVTLRSANPGATLIYTTDGSPPSATNGARLEPGSDTELVEAAISVETTALLRVVAQADGWLDSPTETHTYLFLADVVRQPVAPAGFPTVWNSRSEGAYTANYEMDPQIVDDAAVHDELLAGLRDIPTLSIVMDPEDLFGDDGIYVNSAERGDTWERPASLEYILPDGSTGFQEDAGLQIHGYGWRYHSSTLKHSFRVEFRSEYGNTKLEYPLFEDAPVDRFDSVVLRAGGSKTWLDFRDPEMGQYLHDSFARDTARDMGKIDGHATYVHLYLNGLYWGLYMPVERPEEDFAEEYFGGDDSEYDVINRRTSTNEAIAGDLEAYNTLLSLADTDLSTPEGYAAIQQYLDIDALIDWMLIHQYMTNRDGPCCADGNNQRGIRKREDGAGWRFFVWDMEYSLWYATDSTNISVDVPGHASHVYTRLQQNAEFRARYAERAAMHLTGDGALTPAAAAARYAARADEIYSALLAESARWGDTYREPAYTRDGEWMVEYSRLMDEYFPYRSDEMIDQLRAIGLYAP